MKSNFNLKLKKQITNLVILTASILSVSAIVSNSPAQASADWEYRDGIFGEIKYIKVCNLNWGTKLKVVAEAGSGDRGPENTRGTVTGVQFKMYSSQKFINPWIGYTSSTTWRQLWEKNGNYRWYNWEFSYPGNFVNPDKPLKFAIHVNRKSPGWEYKVYDLGGIKDLGKLPLNTCRTYNDGNMWDD